jgi:uncharacterized protein YfaS (alpha-2-macroglobulin family)
MLQKQTPMRIFICSLLLSLSFQITLSQTNMNTKYDFKWRSVDAAFKKGLSKTAETEIESILKMAKAENNTEQIIKALCNYRVSLSSRDEKSRLHDIELFTKELKNANFPLKQILHSMLGDLYWTYYQENRYLILDRTQINAESEDAAKPLAGAQPDIETWTATDFYNTAYKYFNASLTESEKSKAYPLNKLAEILTPEKNTAHLRPTLYDFLVNRAIQYFAQHENEITKPAYAFEIDDEKAFGDVSTFMNTNFKTSDTTSQKYQVLKLYQQLLSFHLHDADPDALIDADIARILFVNQQSILSNKKELYVAALKNISSHYPNNQQATMASYYIAESYSSVQNNPQAGAKNTLPEAKTICLRIIESYPKSEAAYKAELLIQQIETHSLSIHTEKVILPDAPSLTKIDYRNIQQVFCKIVKLSATEYKEYTYSYQNEYKELLARNPIKSWTSQLPDLKDFQPHSTEIKIDALPTGSYALLISENAQFDASGYTDVALLAVSELAYLYTDDQTKLGTTVFVMHRATGEPLAAVNAKTWTQTYNYNKQKNELKEGPHYTTDKNGSFVITQSDPNISGYSLELYQGKDTLFLNSNIYANNRMPAYSDHTRTFLFTDRSIYRPGQTIYFKGIMVKTTGNEIKKHELLRNTRASITLKDANYEDVKTIELTTNEFGSYSGTFTAPEGLLNGQFQLIAEGGTAAIQVEEYKRPKFEISYDTIQGTYKLNETVQIRGLAKAFAGNQIDGASVQYRVVRTARFPYYWSFYRWGQPSSDEMEITHGTTVTKADGSFAIQFKAIPDAGIDRNTMPVFDYEIFADVTDLNGETRSGSTMVSVSYQSMMLRLELPEQADFNDFNALHIYSTNLAGTHIPASVTLTCKKLQAPLITYRSRLWPLVEINSISEADFRRDFPLDAYNDENNYLKWNEEKTLWTKTIQTTKEGLEYLQKIANNDGWYVIEAKAKDNNGQEITDKKYIRLSTNNEPVALPGEHLLLTKIKTTAQPGETAAIAISTPYQNASLLYCLSKAKQSDNKWVAVNGSQHFEYPVTEEDRGGLSLSFHLVRNNRYYTQTQFIEVPYSNKELHLTLETFRDKMLPGSEQEWKLKISGNQKEKVSAELLATMYDASLDAFRPHNMNGFDFYHAIYYRTQWNTAYNFMSEQGRQISYRSNRSLTPYVKKYAELNWWGLQNNYRIVRRGNNRNRQHYTEDAEDFKAFSANELQTAAADAPVLKSVTLKKPAAPLGSAAIDDEKPAGQNKPNTGTASKASSVQLRSNFSETAFFFPQLQTDEEGNVILKFTAPEALTRWKLLAFAHTKNLSSGQLSSTAVTQKELMIIPNTPRFLREGDQMIYRAKVTNLSEHAISGKATLQLMDALTENIVDSAFKNSGNEVALTLQKGESQAVQWNIQIPQGFTNPVKIKTIVQAADFSDGEVNVVPVLLNSMLVTETIPLPVRANSTQKFSFKNLLNSGSSNTLRHYNLSVEYTGNPAWYAVQALPYLTDYPYECAEQTFNRYYANVLATHMANASPKIKEIFSAWQNKNTAALLSNLQKNQELKSALLQETPWVLEAKSEQQQKQQIATLFNLNRMSRELERTVRELELMQTPNGGFTWFKGMPDDRYMTQYIITGIGKLLHLGVSEVGSERRILQIIAKAIPYLDTKLKNDYEELLKHKTNLNLPNIQYTQIQYLYMRSFFPDHAITATNKTAFEYYKNQAAQYWVQQNRYMQGMTALALNRWHDVITPKAILKSLRENAIHSEEMGMYWKEGGAGYWWYEAPVETQSLLAETFTELGADEQEIDEIKIWLLKNKQTQNWKTSKATADAVYALLLRGTDWLANQPEVEINLGDKKILSKEQQQEAGTGYFKTSIDREEIKASMGNIQVKVTSAGSGTSWGAVYWQYFENLDKISGAATPLSIKKQLYIENNTDKGPALTAITEKSPLKVGDKIKVRIELRVDRDMEYVHMKDMRAACFEPINVISHYKYQGGLGYYEATKDASTNFFFNWLRKGTYVFEYPMFVTNEGNYSNGICTIQCMYAPEFSSHSEGTRVEVK